MTIQLQDSYFMYDPDYLFGLYSEYNSISSLQPKDRKIQTQNNDITNNRQLQSSNNNIKIKNEGTTDNKLVNKYEIDSAVQRIRWTKEEHELFEQALIKHGRSKHKLIQKDIQSKSLDQCVSHSQKFFVQLDNLFARGMKESVSDSIQRLIEKKFPDAYKQSLTLTQVQMATGIYNILKSKQESIVDAYVKYLVSKRI
ncbi:Myb-like_DNA-binding domain-containing protein [Hexamita inflata]|uniref:Myb-like DNA-binding domain-containing protein n=1 Tax=Hexamita inflata TaxID=28002 RepID=A0AA86U5M9_9EUKA|nr:Myb-like DNA-binding domain-containing protein [Hexamita inflata]